MGSSFIKFRGFGFWSHDTYIEDFVREAAVDIVASAPKEEWLVELATHWQLQASGAFGGWIHLHLDEFLVIEERRKALRGIVQAVCNRHDSCDVVHQTGIFLLRLLDGDLTTDASSPLDYMVGRNPRRSSSSQTTPGLRPSVSD